MTLFPTIHDGTVAPITVRQSGIIAVSKMEGRGCKYFRVKVAVLGVCPEIVDVYSLPISDVAFRSFEMSFPFLLNARLLKRLCGFESFSGALRREQQPYLQPMRTGNSNNSKLREERGSLRSTGTRALEDVLNIPASIKY